MKKENAVIEIPNNNSVMATPADLLQIAVSNGAELDKLEKLMDMQLRWEQNEAKKAYHRAMAAFKANPPEIYNDSTVDYQTSKGRTHYTHATLGNITTLINKSLSEHGLSASWKTDQLENGSVVVTCIITHELGYSEQTTLRSAPDVSGGKNPIQAIGSATKYLQRYTILALTGLATKENEDDGAATSEPSVNPVVKASPEYKKLQKEIEMFPEEYQAALNHFGLPPVNVDQCKQVSDFINSEVSKNDAK